jgi:hypothetical protein
MVLIFFVNSSSSSGFQFRLARPQGCKFWASCEDMVDCHWLCFRVNEFGDGPFLLQIQIQLH